MSKPKFTPGPWAISPCSNNFATWDEVWNASMKTKIVTMEQCKTVNGIKGWQDSEEREQAEANARLIAAAPDMYELLKRYSASFFKFGFQYDYDKINSLLNSIQNEQ